MLLSFHFMSKGTANSPKTLFVQAVWYDGSFGLADITQDQNNALYGIVSMTGRHNTCAGKWYRCDGLAHVMLIGMPCCALL